MTYKQGTLHEHILMCPYAYIGNTSYEQKTMYVFNDNDEKIIENTIQYVDGFLNIFDNILMCARDDAIIDKSCKNISITLNRQTGEIIIWKNGLGLPIQIHPNYDGIYIPEIMFGHLFSSINSSRGFIGCYVKLTNIYSKLFEIHTIGLDKDNKKIEYKQLFTNNMKTIHPPEINEHIDHDTCMFTSIRFIADYDKFEMPGLTNDMYNVLKKRCYDLATCDKLKNVNISINGKEIKHMNWLDYIELYYKEKPKIIYEKVNHNWEFGAVVSVNPEIKCISFVKKILLFDECAGKIHNDIDDVNKRINKIIVLFVSEQLDKYLLKNIAQLIIKPYLYYEDNTTCDQFRIPCNNDYCCIHQKLLISQMVWPIQCVAQMLC